MPRSVSIDTERGITISYTIHFSRILIRADILFINQAIVLPK
jgi:hypothetical protein